MHARSALFDLYGDHLRDRDGWAPIAGIVRLLGAVDVAPPAVRTAVSRMVREGWLEPVERQGQRGYAATPRARARLAEAHARIYRTRDESWDGCWHVVVVDHASERARRGRVTAALSNLGYARMAPDTWIAPRENAELAGTLAAEDLQARAFCARYAAEGAELAASLWDLQGLAAAYREFVAQARTVQADRPADQGPEAAFAARTLLVHEWRKFLFRDPGLPAQVLPADWPGHEAAVLFDTTASALLPLAREFVDSCLAPDPKPRS